MPPKGSKCPKRTADETRRVAEALAPAVRARTGPKLGLAETVKALHESGALREGIYSSVAQLRRDVQTTTEAHAKAII